MRRPRSRCVAEAVANDFMPFILQNADRRERSADVYCCDLWSGHGGQNDSAIQLSEKSINEDFS